MAKVNEAVMAALKWILGAITALFSSLIGGAGSFGGYFGKGLNAIGRFLEYMRASFVALLRVKAAWAAVILIGALGWYGGYHHGAQGKTELREQASSAERARKAAADRADQFATSYRKASEEIARLKGEVEAAKAEASRKATNRAPAASKRRAASKMAARPEAAPAKIWWPFK